MILITGGLKSRAHPIKPIVTYFLPTSGEGVLIHSSSTLAPKTVGNGSWILMCQSKVDPV